MKTISGIILAVILVVASVVTAQAIDQQIGDCPTDAELPMGLHHICQVAVDRLDQPMHVVMRLPATCLPRVTALRVSAGVLANSLAWPGTFAVVSGLSSGDPSTVSFYVDGRAAYGPMFLGFQWGCIE